LLVAGFTAIVGPLPALILGHRYAGSEQRDGGYDPQTFSHDGLLYF
jgi:hypothetical protein